jgi:hypothetical protein
MWVSMVNILVTVLYHMIARQGNHANQSGQMQILCGRNLSATMSVYKAADIITNNTLMRMSRKLIWNRN